MDHLNRLLEENNGYVTYVLSIDVDDYNGIWLYYKLTWYLGVPENCVYNDRHSENCYVGKEHDEQPLYETIRYPIFRQNHKVIARWTYLKQICLEMFIDVPSFKLIRDLPVFLWQWSKHK